ncbi:MAG: gamma-glutamylcyclotransferase [Pseudomonadota bacterium]
MVFTDPFRFHPELADQITPAEASNLRDMSTERLAELVKEHGLTTGWWLTDEEREADRAAALATLPEGDIWVFAYGSLMWNPAIHFDTVRRASVPDHARRFILKDIHGGRGTVEQPGLMAALDYGDGCDGLVFRIPAAQVAEETEVLWRRERIGPAYIPRCVTADLSDTSVEALTFVADHNAELIDNEITRADQIKFLATGTGFLGTSRAYLENIASHFDGLGIHDEEVTRLLEDLDGWTGSS